MSEVRREKLLAGRLPCRGCCQLLQGQGRRGSVGDGPLPQLHHRPALPLLLALSRTHLRLCRLPPPLGVPPHRRQRCHQWALQPLRSQLGLLLQRLHLAAGGAQDEAQLLSVLQGGFVGLAALHSR